jgi:hypothetical protein
MRDLNTPFSLEPHASAWAKAVLRDPNRACACAASPGTRCMFFLGGECISSRYGIPGGACLGPNRADSNDVVFILTNTPPKPVNLIKSICKKAPNEYTTVGKEYNLEKLEPSGNHCYVDDLGEYSYITEEVSTFFDI